MNPNNNPQVFSDSENYQPSPIFHYNPQDDDMLTSSPLGQETENFRSNEDSNHVIYAQSHDPYQWYSSYCFFHRPPNHFYHYRVNCEEISCDAIESLLNSRENVTQRREDKYVFFYQQKFDNRFYQVSCEIASPLLVNNCLNKNFLGIGHQNQNMGQEHLSFTFEQKEDLENHLRQYLSQHFLN